MAADKTNDILVGGTLHSIATGNIIAHADEVLDENWGANQAEINQELKDSLSDNTEELELKITELKDTVDNYTVNGYTISSNPTLDNSDIGLGNVTNDAQVKRSEMGVANGVATLGDSGKVPASLLPAYVDDVLEGTYVSETEFTLADGLEGEVQSSSTVYVDTTTNKTYRWSGTLYVIIGTDLALGETSETAYPGDKGKAVTDKVAEVYGANSVINGISDITFDTDDTLELTLSAVNAIETWDGSNETHDLIIPYATTSKAGVMSAADKEKLDESVFADEEDITAETGVLKFKDREYDSDNFSGKGYKILRKNILDGKNILTLDMINETNTIYEIRYDFDLNEETITIPDKCSFNFNGGSIVNGVIKGTLENEYLKPEWFGAKGDGTTNDYAAIKKCIECGLKVVLEGNYLIDEIPSIDRIEHDLEIVGLNNASIIFSDNIDVNNNSFNFIASSTSYYPSLLKCTNLKFIVNTNCDSENPATGLNLFQINAEKIIFDKVEFINNGKYNAFCALYVMDADSIIIDNCYIYDRSAGNIGGALLWYIKRDQSSDNCIIKVENSIIDCDGGDEIISFYKREDNVNSIDLKAFINNCTFYGHNTYEKGSQNAFITTVDTRENGEANFEVNIDSCNFYDYSNDNGDYRVICATKMAGTEQDDTVLTNKQSVVNLRNCSIYSDADEVLFSPRTNVCTFNISFCKINASNAILLDNISYCSITQHAGFVNIDNCDISVKQLYKMNVSIGNSTVAFNNTVLKLSSSYLPLCNFSFVNTKIYSDTLFLRIRSTEEWGKTLVLNNVYFNNKIIDKFFFKDDDIIWGFLIYSYPIYYESAYNVTYIGGRIDENTLYLEKVVLNENFNDSFTAYVNGGIAELVADNITMPSTNKITAKIVNDDTKEILINALIYRYYDNYVMPKSSTSDLLPNGSDYLEVGDLYFNTDLGKSLWWNGTEWVTYINSSDIVTTTEDGLMSSEDKVKFDNMYTGLYDGNLELVTPTINGTWTFYNNAETEVAASNIANTPTTTGNPTLEYGYKALFVGTYFWTSEDGKKDPTSLGSSSSWTTLTESGVTSDSYDTGIVSSATTVQVILEAAKTGFMLSSDGSTIVPASGNDTTTASRRVSFSYRKYYGAMTGNDINETNIKALTSTLSTSKSLTASSVTCNTSLYYVYAYPQALGTLTTIIQDGAQPVLGAFTQSTLTITNDAGASVDLYVYISNNPGAFTNASLEFS